MLKQPRKFVKEIAPWVKGKDVWDMGCGPTSHLAILLLKAGAASVTSVDKEPCLSSTPLEANHRVLRGTRMEDVPENAVDVAIVSWPFVGGCTIAPWLKAANTIIYIGVNSGCTVCFMPGLFTELSRREVLFERAGSGKEYLGCRGKKYPNYKFQDVQIAGPRTEDARPWGRIATLTETRLLQSILSMHNLKVEIHDSRFQAVKAFVSDFRDKL